MQGHHQGLTVRTESGGPRLRGARGGARDLGRGGKWEMRKKGKKRKEKRIRAIESDLARRTQIPLKKHEEWCREHLHFVKKEREEGGEMGVRRS